MTKLGLNLDIVVLSLLNDVKQFQSTHIIEYVEDQYHFKINVHTVPLWLVLETYSSSISCSAWIFLAYDIHAHTPGLKMYLSFSRDVVFGRHTLRLSPSGMASLHLVINDDTAKS